MHQIAVAFDNSYGYTTHYTCKQIVQHFKLCMKLNRDCWIESNDISTQHILFTVKLEKFLIEQVLALMALEVMVQAFHQSEYRQLVNAINKVFHLRFTAPKHIY